MARFGVYGTFGYYTDKEEDTEFVSSEEDESDSGASTQATIPIPEPSPKPARTSRQPRTFSSGRHSEPHSFPSSSASSADNFASNQSHSCSTTGCTGDHFYSDAANSFRVYHDCSYNADEAAREDAKESERMRKRAEKERRQHEKERAKRSEKERLRREAEERDCYRRRQERKLRKEREKREKQRKEESERRKREREEEARRAREESDRQFYQHRWEARFAQARARTRAHPYAQAKAFHFGPDPCFSFPNPFESPPSNTPPLRKRRPVPNFSSPSASTSGSRSKSNASTSADSVHDKKYSKEPPIYFEWYDSMWTEINAHRITSSLSFSEIPWAVAPFPRSHEDITTEKVKSFVRAKYFVSPGLKRVITIKERRAAAKKELLSWHPDKFATRVLDHVADPTEREDIRRAADVVQKALTEYMREAGSG